MMLKLQPQFTYTENSSYYMRYTTVPASIHENWAGNVNHKPYCQVFLKTRCLTIICHYLKQTDLKYLVLRLGLAASFEAVSPCYYCLINGID